MLAKYVHPAGCAERRSLPAALTRSRWLRRDKIASIFSNKEDYGNLRQAVTDMEDVIANAPKQEREVDWASWEKKGVPKNVLNELKTTFDAEWTNGEKKNIWKTLSPEVEKEALSAFDGAIAGAQEVEDYHRLRIRELEVEIAKLKWEKENLDELDVDTVFKRYPHLETRVNKLIDETVWYDYDAKK